MMDEKERWFLEILDGTELFGYYPHTGKRLNVVIFKGDETLMTLTHYSEEDTQFLWIDKKIFWVVLNSKFSMNESDVKKFIKGMVGKHLGWEISSAQKDNGYEENFNINFE